MICELCGSNIGFDWRDEEVGPCGARELGYVAYCDCGEAFEAGQLDDERCQQRAARALLKASGDSLKAEGKFQIVVADCAGEFHSADFPTFAAMLEGAVDFAHRWPRKCQMGYELNRCDYDATGLTDVQEIQFQHAAHPPKQAQGASI